MGSGAGLVFEIDRPQEKGILLVSFFVLSTRREWLAFSALKLWKEFTQPPNALPSKMSLPTTAGLWTLWQEENYPERSQN